MPRDDDLSKRGLELVKKWAASTESWALAYQQWRCQWMLDRIRGLTPAGGRRKLRTEEDEWMAALDELNLDEKTVNYMCWINSALKCLMDHEPDLIEEGAQGRLKGLKGHYQRLRTDPKKRDREVYDQVQACLRRFIQNPKDRKAARKAVKDLKI